MKAAWILGSSILLSTLLLGGGAIALFFLFMHQAQEFSQRSAEAVLHAPEHTKVSLRAEDGTPIKIGFEPKLPLAVRAENSMDDNTGKRAAFQVDVKPNLQK